jgi:opacity protein-like surface antigen
MKKVIFAAAAASALALAAMPAAAQGWYAQVNVGGTVKTKADARLSFTPDDTAFDPSSLSGDGDIKEGFGVGAAAGYALGNGVRLEGETFYTSNDLGGVEDLGVGSVKLQHMGVFANLLYDIPVSGAFQPYVGGGVGYGSTTFNVDSNEQHDQGAAWQLKAGVSYPLNDVLSLDVGYRYMHMADWQGAIDGVDIDDDPDAGPGTVGIKFKPSAHILTVGARFKLGGGSQ